MEYAFRPTLTRVLLLLVVFAALAAIPMSAQISKGSISGTVLDPSGAAVPGAQIKATSKQTAQVLTSTSDASGAFHLALVPVGTYDLEINKSGFRKTAVGNVEISSNVENALGGVRLELGVATEVVEVTNSAPLVESTQSQITNTFTSAYLNNIPGIQENQGLDNLTLLLPGVANSRDANFSNTNGVGFSVNGLRGRTNDQQIDGQNNNDNSVGGPGIFVGDTEFVDQYQVTTNNFGPEYGRNAGSVVNVVTKSGTNAWHGAIFATEGNSIFQTLSNQQKIDGLTQVPHYNDIYGGATIGGPWIKNRVFFFGGFDTEIIPGSTVFSTGNLTPTPIGIGEMSGCYTSTVSQQAIAALNTYGPYGVGGGSPTALGAPQVVPLAGVSPNTGAAIPGFVPNDPSGVCNVQMAGVQRTLGDSFHEYDWVGRLDVISTQNDTVYGRYIWQKLSNFNVDEGNAVAGYPVNVPSTGQQLGLSWTHKFSDRMVNELRLNYGRIRVEFGGNTIGTVPRQGQLESALANVEFLSSSLLGYGPPTNMPEGRITNTYQVQDNWNYAKGKHQIKAGINFTYQRSPNLFLPNVNGEFAFADWTAYGANEPSFTSITLGSPSLDFREKDTFLYIGDDYKVSDHLTVNLGLTWSYFGQPVNLFNTNDVKRQAGSDPFWDPSLPLSVTTQPSVPSYKKEFGPSVGFAYAPGWGGWLFGQNKTVFRGGYRLSYDPPVYNVYLNMASSAPQVLAQTLIDGTTGVSPVPIPAAPFGPTVRAATAAFVTPGIADPRSFNQTQVSPNFGPDKVHGWSFGIQREFGSHLAAEARYVGNHATGLFQTLDSNPFIGGLADGVAAGVFPSSILDGLTPCPVGSAVVPTAAGRVDCSEGKIRQRANTAYSDYNALQAELRANNIFKQLTLKSNYTWSKNTSNSDEIFGTFGAGGTTAFAQDPLDTNNAEHSLSGIDFPKTWTLSFYEQLPMFRNQHGFFGHVLGGWALAGSYIIQSGQPYTPTQIFLNGASGGFNAQDQSFLNSFNSGFENLRPFVGNTSAPDSQVGIYAADACNIFGAGCGAAPNSLLSLNALNSTGTETAVQANQVHFVVNGLEADTLHGTPFGNARRNSLRDAMTNTGNFEVAKTTKWGERATITMHMSMTNAFNHPNYGYTGPGSAFGQGIDPFIEDAGLSSPATGFADPTVFDSGHRNIKFGLKVAF